MTGFVLSRLIFETIMKKDKVKNLTFTTNITKSWFQNTKINFIGNRKIGYFISGTFIIISIISFSIRGLNQGIDFSGGRNYVVRFDKAVKTEEIKGLLRNAFDGQTPNVIAIKSNETDNSDNRIRISTNFKITDQSNGVDEEISARLYKGLKPLLKPGLTQNQFVKTNIMSSQKVGPTVADDIKVSAIWAVLLSIIAIGLYILIRFRNVAFSVGGIASLTHDALIVLGLYSLLYSIMPFSLEIDQSFIAAILTVIGYSINDTVIIFDRVREYRALYPKRDPQATLNDALNSTLGRTFNTTFTTAIVLVAIFLFGGESIRGFVFALLIGIVVGTYSSLFIAVPFAHEILDKKHKKEHGNK
jgi:SecD/SecF fusion protein